MRTEIANPYWDTVQTFPNSDLRWSKHRFEPEQNPGLLESFRGGPPMDPKRNRSYLVKRYSWSIPTTEEILWLAKQIDGRRVVEIGAGTGYWAWLLYQAGVTVIAYDEAPKLEDNTYFDNESTPFFPVQEADGPTVIRQHSDDVLMLCWPNYASSFAVDTLRAYSGDTLIFKGEGAGGCTGDDDFFELLESEWHEIASCPHTVQWGGIHDFLWIYQRDREMIKEEP